MVCHATTPLGAAVACPEHLRALRESCPYGCSPDDDDDECRQVYMGHNIVGAEWHWLPYKVLQSWWQTQYQSIVPSTLYDRMAQYLATLAPDNDDWCPYNNDDNDNDNSGARSRPHNRRDYQHKFLPCSVPLAHAVDHLAYQVLAHVQQTQGQQQQLSADHPKGDRHAPGASPQRALETSSAVSPHLHDWSSFYASLPVLRTTIVREPWGWLVSKFFWQG